MTSFDAPFSQVVVVVPAHNEREHLPQCLRALTTAGLCLPMPVTIVVVLDSCDDGSEALAGEFGPDVHFISVDAGNVGATRAAGFEYARTLCGEELTGDTWYATTDADSVVDADWLVRMVAADADMVLGVVRVPNWRNFSPAVARRYLSNYRSRGPGHRHVHGANMGFRADLYWGVGGFRALRTGEDVELVERFERAQLSIHRDRDLSVATSDRRDARAPGGFADHLRKLSRTPRTGKAKAS
ncbi:glycosyltransferase family 2 protein [Mycobacterium sp. pW049]|uniref:glycosyltransferase n=1 Tax=[Mycobacterium] bulgaricum TaxID=3238985 RepID=UPI00351B73F5